LKNRFSSLSLLKRFRLLPPNFNRNAALIVIGLFLISCFAYIHTELIHPQHYHFQKLKASNGVVLYTIRTNPENVRLKAINTNVTETTYFGINGGFFWEGSLLSMAVINHEPLIGVPGEYGSGWFNTGADNNFKRGTLVWDGLMKRFSVQIVGQAGELFITDIYNYWAQGGVSMSLGKEADWKNEIIVQKMPAYDETHMRTGIVYDENQQLYMIVTPTLCTIEQFRTAILEKLGTRRLVDGIFLDGDGSSQLQSPQAHLVGDHRQVYQMLSFMK
jgi:hypothetical protein